MSNIRSSKPRLTLPEANAILATWRGMCDAQDRRDGRSLKGADTWPHPNTINAMNRWGLRPEEVKEWRKLVRLDGYTSEAAAQVIVRSRRRGA